MRTVFFSLAVSATLLIGIAGSAVPALATGPIETVSPGHLDGLAAVDGACPSFSWTEGP